MRVATLLLIGLATFLTLVEYSPSEPVYQGRRIRYWFEQYAQKTSRFSEATNAIIQLGDQASPYLASVIGHSVSPWRRYYRHIWQLLPDSISGKLPDPIWRDEASLSNLYSALDALVLLGPKARPAVPAVIDLLNDEDVDARRSIPFILGTLGPITTNVVPALIDALTNNGDWYTEEAALRAIGRIGPAATNAIPVLLLELKHCHPDFRAWAAEALGNIGPQSKSAIPALLVAERDQNVEVSDAVHSALLKIEVMATAAVTRAK